ncbi:hypothetical protein DH2020_007662 [Rehmannia glutinosa]|uniref:SWIM-type domain-containing protein n=1 Tax=Rehmannia glutinosa TaxID=99300 RepID=A0ABR0TYT8_REHGL
MSKGYFGHLRLHSTKSNSQAPVNSHDSGMHHAATGWVDAGHMDLEEDTGGGTTVANRSHEQFVASNMSISNDEVLPINSIVDQLENKLAVGQIMKSVEDAYLLYCNYAHAKGFSVKKGDQRYFPRSNELQAKEFECSCEGVKDEKRSSDRLPFYQKLMTRTKCKARFRIGREKGGEWKVTRFVMEHNHEMVSVDQTHLLRSSRNISHAQRSTLEAMVRAGISVANAVSYMENEAQGTQNLGFTVKDAYDYFNRLRKHTKVEDGDASALLQYFINKSNKEAYFYWNVQVDDDNRVMNFFFRDYRCRVDYEYFGDVLSVDTTYRTNKYNLICAPFIGINHHRQNVMFGLAFMSDETESSFEWLFRTFLDSMSDKQPETIFTDQCQAMMNAIETVFPCAHHRLCQWHINQNAPSHLGSLNGDSKFKQLWHKCMNYCESEEEFEVTWKILMDEYNLGDHKWLNGMYKLRHKWATAFSNHKFSAGLLATSRSESTNAVLKKAGNKTISLYDFVLNYEKVQNNWRAIEKAEDTRCRHGKPSMIVKHNPLLNHVADIYTLSIYRLFELELIDSLNTTFAEQPLDLSVPLLEFKVKSLCQNSRIRKVVFDKRNYEVKCSCHKFESMGILCKHVLKVFNFVDLNILPKPYIKKRWMKNVRNIAFDESRENRSGSGSGSVSQMVFVNQLMRSTYDLAMRCKAHEEARNILSGILDSASQQVNALLENLSLDDCNVFDGVIVDEDNGKRDDLSIRNPLCAKSRGITNTQIVRYWDDKSKKRRGKDKPESSIRYCVVDAFTESAFKGNPAAVCLLEEERDEDWQAVAREFNLSETCYLTQLSESNESTIGCPQIPPSGILTVKRVPDTKVSDSSNSLNGNAPDSFLIEVDFPVAHIIEYDGAVEVSKSLNGASVVEIKKK